MTLATLARQRCDPQVSLPAPTPRRRWIIAGLLIGLAVVCHGCHTGDRDDELSLAGVKSPSTQPQTSAKWSYEPRPLGSGEDFPAP
jgi:hypothetical protein